jgi:hypothetical protein
MRYFKYSKIITFWLLLLTLSLIQCKKETGFTPFPFIKGQVTDAVTKEPIEDAMVTLWIDGIYSDTLTYYTDNKGIYSSERINNRFDKSLTAEASKINPEPGEEHYAPVRTYVSSDILKTKMSVTSDTLYVNFELYPAYSTWHTVIPKKLDFLNVQYVSYIMIINDGFDQLYWDLGENNTGWMSIYWVEVYNTVTDMNHLKRGGFVKFQVNISRLLAPGTYDSSILIITDQGNTIIPVHVVIE